MTTKTKRDSYVENVSQGRIDLMDEIAELQKLDDPQSSDSYREAYAIDTQVVKKILLSGGGPSDGIKLYFYVVEKNQLELSHGVYWRSDWGQYQESDLSESEAQAVYDFYMGGYAEIGV